MNVYIVTFETHEHCEIRKWTYHCFAKNAKEACATAKEAWNRKPHMFAIHAVRKQAGDPDKPVGSLPTINRFVMTDSYAWRVNGKNVFMP